MSKNDNKETLRLLRGQLKALKKAGETELAEQLQARISALQNQPAEIVMYFEEGRVHFQTPYPGYKRRYPFSMKLKEAGVDADGEATHEWHPKTKTWSFKATAPIVNKVKSAIGDFFSEAPLVNQQGERIGTLPASTYTAPPAEAAE